MKRIFGLIILFLLCINIVLAGETYKLDFSKQDENLVGLKERDRVEFNLKDERNTIILTKLRESSAEIKAYIALNTRNIPYYSDLKKGNKFVFDVDDDGMNDMEVKLYKIEDDLVMLYFNKLEGSLWPVGNIVLDTDAEKIRSYRAYDLFVIGFFILSSILIIALILKYHKAKRVEENERKMEKILGEN